MKNYNKMKRTVFKKNNHFIKYYPLKAQSKKDISVVN